MHIYKREFVEAQNTQLKYPIGQRRTCWAIGFPQEGQITRLIVRQSSGASLGFTVNLYDRQVCDMGSGSSASVAEPDPMTAELAKIIPTQTVAAGDTLELRQHDPVQGGPWTYRNREGSYAVPVRAVYLQIDLQGGTADGATEFEVAIECEVGNEA